MYKSLEALASQGPAVPDLSVELDAPADFLSDKFEFSFDLFLKEFAESVNLFAKIFVNVPVAAVGTPEPDVRLVNLVPTEAARLLQMFTIEMTDQFLVHLRANLNCAVRKRRISFNNGRSMMEADMLVIPSL